MTSVASWTILFPVFWTFSCQLCFYESDKLLNIKEINRLIIGHNYGQKESMQKRVETHRSGIFRFQLGVDLASIEADLLRVEDAHRRFSSIPIIPDVATRLEKEVVAASVFGTNTIEGGTLSEEETAVVIERFVESGDEKEQRVLNIKRAYEKAETFSQQCIEAHTETGSDVRGIAVPLQEIMFSDLHALITHQLSHPFNVPGQYRDNQKGQLTKVGDAEHGGVYTPPKCKDDITLLIKHFLEWINSEEVMQLSPLLRAPLAHYYFERIHPFWDGNGRVGRVIEMLILKCAGYKYAHFALSRFYLDNIDEYFSVFNRARKAEENGEANPNTVFIRFFLKGMLTVINDLHDRANRIIALVLYENMLNNLLREKKINQRQYTIVTTIMETGLVVPLATLQAKPWYQSLYRKLTPKTRSRDLKGLEEHHVLEVTKDKELRLLVP